MPFPHAIATILRQSPNPSLPGESSESGGCEGARHHSPTPLRVHDVEIMAGRTVKLCGTCRDNIAVLLWCERLGIDDIPWRRSFGNKIRSLIQER